MTHRRLRCVIQRGTLILHSANLSGSNYSIAESAATKSGIIRRILLRRRAHIFRFASKNHSPSRNFLRNIRNTGRLIDIKIRIESRENIIIEDAMMIAFFGGKSIKILFWDPICHAILYFPAPRFPDDGTRKGRKKGNDTEEGREERKEGRKEEERFHHLRFTRASLTGQLRAGLRPLYVI